MNPASPLPPELSAVDYDPFASDALERVVPSTEPQREIWLAAKLGDEASLAYNESITLRLRGALDREALHGALQDVVDRRDALRASFGPDGETFCVSNAACIDLPLTDLSGQPPAERDNALNQRLRHAVETSFVLEQGPLLRAELLRCAVDDHVLVLTAHHIVCDGWSWWVIVRELAALYAARRGAPREALPAAESFADYALAEAAHPDLRAAAADEAYWLARFTEPVPPLELPLDHPRPPRRTFASAREDHVFDATLLAAIKRLGARRGASLFATLLGSFAALLTRLADQSDVVIGIPAAAQSLDGHDNLVGHCVNLLPLRWNIDAAVPFENLLDTTQTTLLDALEHQRYTFGTLLKKLGIGRDPSRLPLASVLFNIDQALDHEATAFPDLAMDFASNARRFENFELFVNAVQEHGTLHLECQYNTDLFDAGTIRRWLAAYESLLRAAIERPQAMLGELPLVDETQRLELTALQPPRTPFDAEQRAHEFFERQCDRAPARIALNAGVTTLNYIELDTRANRIAHLLRARGVHHGALVGIALDRDADMLAALLGVLKSGAGYVPLDPAFPAERLGYMISDASLAALITRHEYAPRFDLRGRPVLELDRLVVELEAAPATRIGRDADAAGPESIAYVIYTSGSTGKPKGVLVPHRATANFLTAMQRAPGIHSDDRLVAVTTLSFDIAFMELMLPLCVGAQIVMASRDQARDGAALRALIESSKATVLQATPAGWRVLLEAGWQGAAHFKAVTGGEPLTLDLAEALLVRCAEVWNGYGPTEATVYATFWKVENPRAGIVIGRPVANATAWVFDGQRKLCPIGVPGEIWIGGAGVALGYLNRPELTTDRFVADLHSNLPGAHLYRTGDRGRWLANGTLEHLGRVDFQVKLRGYRIEPGEIEANLISRPEISHAAVIVREDRPGDARLVAYLVKAPGTVLDEALLRTHLRNLLPDYMIPQHFVMLDAMPLLPNGKLDRNALPTPHAQSVASCATRLAPRNECEQRVAAAMEAVLALSDLDVRDNFFALGGHSLLATQLTARLNREFGIALSFRTLFDAPTIEGLAAAVDAQTVGGTALAMESIQHRADQAHGPLSLMQERLWSLEELQPGRLTYNTPSAHRLRGELDESAFEHAFQELIRRQPSMRTAIQRNGSGMEQVVAADLEFHLFPAEDLSSLPENERESLLLQRLQTLTDLPFDLTRAPLFNARMFRMAHDDHVLFFMPHHIIWDGWSFDIFYDELSQLYRAFMSGAPSPLPPLPVTYVDFSAWHSRWLDGPQFQAQLAFWRERLAHSGPSKALPTDKPRRPGMSGEGRTEWIRVPKGLTDALHEVARSADATLNMVLLALYYVLLHGSSGHCNLVIATPVRGRNQADVESIMGYFTNLLPLHLSVDPDLTFTEFLRCVKETVIGSLGNPDVPLEYLQREPGMHHGAGSTMYNALFSFQDARQRVTNWAGLAHEQVLLFQRGATEDLGLWFLENANGMIGGVTYNADILHAETARLLRDRFLALLTRIIENPRELIAALTKISTAEIEQLRLWNTTTTDVIDTSRGLASMFEAQADLTPSRTAITFGSWGTSYAEIEQRANRIAACLQTRGVSTGSVVGLCIELGVNRVAAMIGLFKAGATCLLLDPADPSERLRSILADARASMLIGNVALERSLDWPRPQALWLDADTAELIAATGERPAMPDPQNRSADADAIVVYAPHRTGKFHGVGVSYRTLAARVSGMQRSLGVSSDDHILGTAPPSSGFTAVEILLALSTGAEFIQASSREADDGSALAVLARASGATVIFASPALWQSTVQAGWTGNQSVRAVSSGATLKPDLAFALTKSCGELHNVFASAQAGIVATSGRIDLPNSGIHNGRPLPNTMVWILDGQQQPCPIGTTGEIHVGGVIPSRPIGLLAEAAEADDIADLLSGAPDARMTRTHVLGRWLANGTIETAGRSDRQLCMRGRDVEPAVIEALLLAQHGVARAVAVARDDVAGFACVDAYVVPTKRISLDLQALRSALASGLATHEMPRHLLVLDALPFSGDGTIDIDALPNPVDEIDGSCVPIDVDQPTTPGEQLLADTWRELLHAPRISVSDNFFDLGGHSLLAMTMVAKVEEQTGVRLNLLRIANGTLRALAAELPESGKHVAVVPSSPTLGQRVRKLFSLGKPDKSHE